MFQLHRRASRVALAAAAVAVAVPVAAVADNTGSGSGAAASAGDRAGYGERHGTSARFATVKHGTKLVVFGPRDRRDVRIKGLAEGERVVGIDVRPATGVLYGVSSASRVFTIDPRTGATGNARTLSVALVGTSFGVDFNPSVDRLRIVSDAEQNLRANVDDGATTADAPLAYPAGDRNAGQDPAVTAVGYTFAPMGGPTALYDVDSARDTFALQNPPNAGVLNSIGPIGVDVPSAAGFDIAGRDTFTGYALLQMGGHARLYELRFDRNGRAQDLGIALGGQYDGLAVLDGYRS